MPQIDWVGYNVATRCIPATDLAAVTETARKEAHRPSRWDLSELLPDPAASSEVISRLETDVAAFEDLRDRLRPDLDRTELVEILKRYEALAEVMYRLSGYAALWFSEDTQSRQAQAFRSRIQQVLTSFQNRILFFDLWWKELDDKDAEAMLPETDRYPDHTHYLRTLRLFRPFTLDESSEQIINLKDANGMHGILTLYSMLTNRLDFQLEVDGHVQVLTRDELMSFSFSPRAELRAAAYQELFRVYEREASLLGQIYFNRVRDWASEQVELRGYESPIAARNLANDVPHAAVETLLQVVRDNTHLFRRYFRLKAGWLGLDRLRRYDIYAPLTTSDRRIPYDQAVRRTLETLAAFHPDLRQHAQRVFADNHIDSEIRKGKRGGGFCSTVLPGMTPWVLINYTGRIRDVATLAHELGHAVHAMLASRHSILTQHPSLPLAETASVFVEMLMTDRLLHEEREPLARRELLAAFLDDVWATVVRQAYFVLFELEAHEAIVQGASLDDVNRLYVENLTEQFDDSVTLAPEFCSEWLTIPHLFQVPFYCYAYSFGQLLTLALYRRYLEEGEAFKEGYLRLLAYGGSARPQEILAEAGIDMTDDSFWQGGFAIIADRMAELEAIEV